MATMVRTSFVGTRGVWGILVAALACPSAQRDQASSTPDSRQEPADDRFEEDVAQLVRELRASAPAARRDAASRLGEIGPDAKAAVQPLGDALNDADVEVRRSAAVALFRMEREVRLSFPCLSGLSKIQIQQFARRLPWPLAGAVLATQV